ncbi:MAG: hypothetical protein NZ516_09690 [Raineya sp.]|nr:hypothetical protein [Raineya sp.]
MEIVEEYKDEEETYIDVSGRVKNAQSIENYGLEFTKWDKWLGMDLASETIENFSDLEIIAYCLYEMTFLGYDE